MLYLIGGPGRAGKTFLAEALRKQHNIAYFSTDYLMMGLAKGCPPLKVDPNQSDEAVAQAIRPVLQPLLTAMLENDEHYCVEGIAITPDLALELSQQFPNKVKSCVLGFCDILPEEKLEQDKKYPGNNPWLQDMDHPNQLRLLKQANDYSQQLKMVCLANGLLFVDTGSNFEQTIQNAKAELIP